MPNTSQQNQPFNAKGRIRPGDVMVGIELRPAVGGGLPVSLFRYASRDLISTLATFPEAPPKMPDRRVSQVRFQTLAFPP
jgi:hypothetical protein